MGVNKQSNLQCRCFFTDIAVLTPTCSNDSNNGGITEQSYLNFTCDLQYFGISTPNVTWYDCDGNEIKNATNTFGQHFVTSTISIPAYLPFVLPFKFETWMPDAPGRIYTWESSQITVYKKSKLIKCL